ncbi:BZIP domain-containing protein [Aphelenchoides fujianensis]|nr:BZIP domain-containing protein [Aphelenchoides fujianensis]
MTTPFTGEDLVKRSFFSSIINLRINKPNKNPPPNAPPPRNPWENFNEVEEPCSTWRLQQHDQQMQLQQHQQHQQHQQQQQGVGDHALSQQLEDTLNVTSPTNPHFVFEGPNEIFHEIVLPPAAAVDAHQRHSASAQWMPPHTYPLTASAPSSAPPHAHATNVGSGVQSADAPNYAQLQPRGNLAPPHVDQRPYSSPPVQPLHCPREPLVCPNCMHTITPVPLSVALEQRGEVPRSPDYAEERKMGGRKREETPVYPSNRQQEAMNVPLPAALNEHQSQIRALLGAGGVSLEELVKLIVSTVKDTARQPTSPAPVLSPLSNAGLSPAEILQRKRQQNNEAAARYRKRQKEAKMSKQEEMEHLSERNRELRAQIHGIQSEMQQIRSQLLPNRDKP